MRRRKKKKVHLIIFISLRHFIILLLDFIFLFPNGRPDLNNFSYSGSFCCLLAKLLRPHLDSSQAASAWRWNGLHESTISLMIFCLLTKRIQKAYFFLNTGRTNSRQFPCLQCHLSLFSLPFVPWIYFLTSVQRHIFTTSLLALCGLTLGFGQVGNSEATVSSYKVFSNGVVKGILSLPSWRHSFTELKVDLTVTQHWTECLRWVGWVGLALTLKSSIMWKCSLMLLCCCAVITLSYKDIMTTLSYKVKVCLALSSAMSNHSYHGKTEDKAYSDRLLQNFIPVSNRLIS